MRDKFYKNMLRFIGCFIFMMFIGLNIENEARATEIEEFYEYDFTTKKESYGAFANPDLMGDEILEGEEGEISSNDFEEDDKISTYSIIDEDNRQKITNTKVVPLRWIGYVNSFWPDGRITRSTAWLYGKQMAMTVGHAIYDRANKCYPVKIVFCPGYNNGQNPFGSYTAVKARVTTSYVKNGTIKHDAGVIKLDAPVGQEIGYFRVQYKTDVNAYTGQKVWIAGYPTDKGLFMYRMGGDITGATDYSLQYKIDTTTGQQGAPIYIRDGDTRTVIGMSGYVGNGYNQGVRITQTLFNWMRNTRKEWA